MNVVITKLKQPKTRHKDKGAVREKLLRDADGRPVRVFSLDANSTTFSDDLTRVFARNVAKARQENKRLFGSARGFGGKRAAYSELSSAAGTRTKRGRGRSK